MRLDFARYTFGSKNLLKIISRNLSNLKRNAEGISVQHYRPPHKPVLANKVAEYLKPETSNVIVDMTFGAGGHTKKLLAKSNSLKIICLDRDPTAYNIARELQQSYPQQVIPLHGKFSDLPELLSAFKYPQNSIDGFLFDFGCSSMQFDAAERGFSISEEGPLDMRMNPADKSCPTAADVLAKATEGQLAKIFKVYGDERRGRDIAKAIIEARYTIGKIKTTGELCALVENVLGTDGRRDKLGRFSHVATKVFQALRIFVNNELNEINHGMIVAEKYLKVGGILAALSFHSLEDTIVKRHLTAGNLAENAGNHLPLKFFSYNTFFDEDSVLAINSSNWKSLTKHVITPSQYEINVNPRSRSAKLRVAMKTG